jgi:outer membrane protein TolC
MKTTRVLRTGLVFLVSFPAWAGPLSLSDYLNEVESKHGGYQSARLGSRGAELRRSESGLAQSWTLSAGAEQRNDFRFPIGVAFQTKSTVYSLGISKLTSFGLSGKLGMTVTPLSFENVAPQFAAFLPFNSYYDVATTLELSQSLWRNGFGRATRAQEALEESVAKATQYRTSFAARQIQAQAEAAYWNAAAYQEILRIQKENLDRAVKLVQWSKGRVDLDLADKADLLQAESMQRLRQLEVAAAQSDYKTLCRTFNSLRGIDSEELTEKLAPVYIENVETVRAMERAPFRDDVLASREEANAAYATARLGRERNKPNLEVYVSHSLSGRNGTFNDSMAQLAQANFTLTVFGIRFATPLSFGTQSDNLEGYALEQKAAELNRERKLFEQESEWKELSRKLVENKEKLLLARQLEKAQDEKYRYEQARLKSAKSTLFQVLNFEQDFASAQLSRIQKETELRAVLTQMKLFGGKS